MSDLSLQEILSNPEQTDLSEIEKEDLVTLYAQAREMRQQFDIARKMFSEELVERLKDKSGEIIGSYEVSKRTRVYCRTKLEKARELGAVKTEETVDKDKLKNIYSKGVEVPGMSETTYVVVRERGEEE